MSHFNFSKKDGHPDRGLVYGIPSTEGVYIVRLMVFTNSKRMTKGA